MAANLFALGDDSKHHDARLKLDAIDIKGPMHNERISDRCSILADPYLHWHRGHQGRILHQE